MFRSRCVLAGIRALASIPNRVFRQDICSDDAEAQCPSLEPRQSFGRIEQSCTGQERVVCASPVADDNPALGDFSLSAGIDELAEELRRFLGLAPVSDARCALPGCGRGSTP